MKNPQAAAQQAKDAKRFLAALWPSGIPEGRRLLTWRLAGEWSDWWLDADKAAEAAAGKADLYVGCSLGPSGLTNKQRGKAKDAQGIPGVWMDVDLRDEKAHKSDALPGAVEQAETAFPCPPTLLVHSGHGLQAWWLFDAPWLFANDADRALAADVVVRFQRTVQVQAAARGWKLDSTADLSRVLRLPGTLNAKYPPAVPVRVLEWEGPRYARETLSAFGTAGEPSGASGSPGANGKPLLAGEKRSLATLLEGVGEGDRNNAAASLIGSALAALRDPTDNQAVLLAWFSVRAWNEKNAPPLADAELRKVFESILRRERERAIEADFGAAFAAATDRGECAAAAAKAKPNEPPPAGNPLAGWRVEILLSDPRRYRIYSPFWSASARGGYVEIQSGDYTNPPAIVRAAVAQANVWPPPAFPAAWMGTKKSRGLGAILLETAERIVQPSEASRPAYVASIVLGILRSDDSYDAISEEWVAAGCPPTTVADGGIAYVFTSVLNAAATNAAAPERLEVSDCLRDAGSKRRKVTVGGKRVNYDFLPAEGVAKLAQAAGEDDGGVPPTGGTVPPKKGRHGTVSDDVSSLEET